MKRFFTVIIVFSIGLFTTFNAYSQCANSFSAGSVGTYNCGTPSTYAAGSGTYVTFNNLLSGGSYTFESCGTSWNSMITLSRTNNTAISTSSSACGDDGSITWTSTFNGSVRLHVNNNGCVGWVNGQGSAIISYYQNNNINITSSGNPLCPGNTRTLTATPSGGSWSGTGVSGSTFTAPSTPGNYTVTYTFGACSQSQTLQVYQPASNPSGAVASPNPICPGDNSTLSVTGGSTGNDGSNWLWYSGNSCSGTPFASGVSTSVSPGSTQIYSVRAAGGTCAATSCTSVSVTVNQNSTLTNASSSQSAICIGESVNLTANGTLGTGAVWEWYAGVPCTGSPFTTSSVNTIQVSPTTSTTYYVRAVGTCNTTSCQSVSVIVNPLPTPSFSPIGGPYCIDNSTPIDLTGYVAPSGGSFSGTGVSGTNWVPSLAAVGSNTLTYTYTDGNGCTNTANQSVTVTGLPLVSFSGLGSQYCVSSSTPVTLTGFPTNSGGTFTGSGVSDNGNGTASFVPSTAGSGLHNITYTYVDANGCTASQTQTVNVLALPSLTFSGLSAEYCVSNSPVTLSGFPSGGTFSGTGVSGSTFDPGAAGVGGPYTITYSYTDGNGCSNTTSQTVTVNALPTVSFSGLNSAYCENASNATLTGSPSGGTFTGTGIVNGNVFNPSAAGVGGPYSITYTYTDGNGCTNSQTQTVTVNALPVVSFSGLASDYCIDAAFVSLTGSPSGGTFSGAGISGNNFFPSTAGAGTHTITYTYTDGNNCTNTSSQTVVVNALPVISFQGLATEYCVSANSVTLTGSQAPLGSFSGAGISDNGNGTATFDPGSAGSGGPYTITYAYTDGNGCSNTSSQSVTVNPLPVLSINGLGAMYCIDGSPAALSGGPVGGTFSGPGITGNNFYPNVAGVGTHTITYSYTDGNGCFNSITQNVDVVALPIVGFSGLALQYCVDASPVTLTGNPTGGTFSGTGVSGSTFDPSVAGVGSHTVTYTYSDGNSCTNTISQNVQVDALPVVSFLGLSSQYCVDGAASTLTGSPSGGTFSGPGIGGNTFDPSVAGTGTHTITYTYTDGNSCTNSTTQSVVVDSLPVVTFSGMNNNYCVDASPVALTGSPAGGVFSGQGISGNTFFPNVAGVGGPYSITYTYTDGNGCDDSNTQTVTVNPLPVVSYTGLAAEYCVNDAAVTLTGTPSGGTFSGPGISGSSFDPATAGAGTHTIVYTYTDINNCTNTSSQTVIVHALPLMSFAGLAAEYCVDDAIVTLQGNQAPNGTFSGAGITDNGNGTASFDPAAAGVGGPYTITYSYTDGNSCTNTATNTVVVHDLPVVSFTGLGTEYCVDASAVTLTGNFAPAGSFSGAGITDNNDGTASFDPASAGAGSHEIYYSYTDGNSCVNIDTQVVVVNPLPVVSFTGLASAYCEDANPVTLTGSPNGGVFSGPGVSGNSFDPALATPGSHEVIYTYTDANGCVNADTQQVTVNPLPVVSFSGFNGTYCEDDNTPVSLTGSPSGGIFSGPGINGPFFTPSVADDGNHIITYTYTDNNGCTNTSSQVVVVNALPTVTLSGPAAAYCVSDTNSVLLTGTPAGGTFTGPGVNIDQFVPSAAGTGTHTITYTYTDGNACTNSTTLTVVVNGLPVVDFTGLDAEYCIDDPAATLTPSPTGGAFSGPGVSGSMFDPAVALDGTHTVTYVYTDGNSCTDSSVQTVVVNPLPTPTITPSGSNAICAGSTITLDANGGYTTYSWSSGGSGQSINVTQAGSYTVTVTDVNGCVNSSDPTTVVVNQLPVVDLGPDTIICNNASITLDAGGGNTIYAWGHGPTVQTTTVSQTGVYTVTVTDPNGCVNSDAIAVTIASLLQPTVTSNGPTTFCEGQSVTLTTGNYASYLWSNTETNQSTIISEPGTYSVMVTDSMGCNGFSAPVVVTVLPLPQPFVIPDGPTEFCVGESVTLNAGVGFIDYLWSPNNEVTSSLVVTQAGNYSVTVTGTNGCQNTSAQVTVIVNQLPNPTITANGPTEFCEGSNVVLDAGPGYASYLWTSGSQTQTITVTETGDYGVIVLDGNGCVDSSLFVAPVSVTVWDPSPSILVQGGTLTCDPSFTSYQWYLNGALVPGATLQSYTPSISGNYHVEVVDENGCEGASLSIEHSADGIDDYEGQYTINVYPNPSNGIINMRLEMDKVVDARIELKNMLGQLIIPMEDVQNTTEINRVYNINHLPQGIYILQVSTTNGNIVKRIIKE